MIQGKVLIVDDDRTTRAMVRTYIGKLPIEIAEAGDGKEALQIIGDGQFDLIISDLIMPRMSGLMLLHSLIEKGIHIPFIIITGFSDKESAIQAIRLGVFDYLEKPVLEDDLCAVVIEALRIHREHKSSGARQNSTVNLASKSANPRAKALIMKMRAYAPVKGPLVPLKEGDENWANLKALFAKEALQLIDFSFRLLREWNQKTHNSPDLGAILRIIQGIRFAASVISLAHIADIAWHCEAAIASLKLVPEEVNVGSVSLIERGIKVLDANIRALDEKEVVNTINDLQSLMAKVGKIA